MKKYQETATVLEQTEIAPEIFSLWLQTNYIASDAKPGQFVALYSEDKSRLLPRPISICEIEQDQNRLRLVYRIAGCGTKEFAGLTAGDAIRLVGPLGNGFQDIGKKALLVGGGIGIPPMLEFAKQMTSEKEILLGVRDRAFMLDDFQKQGRVYLSSDTGACGVKGTVIDAILENNLQPEVIYACGPTPMLAALKEYAQQHHIPCYISMEEKMACGIGACLACVCKTTSKDEHTNVHNKRICKEGPVFLADEVIL